MTSFEVYLKRKEVIKRNPDHNRARSLMRMAESRLKFARSLEFPNFKLENAYEAIIEAVEALMAVKGYKSYSHAADIAFLREIGFESFLISKIDSFRFLRHRSKYYGDEISKSVADEAVKFAEIILSEIKEMMKEL